MLAMTLLVRNERDIIAATLDFHLRCGVDHVIVTDNGSDDGTRDVLSRYDRLSEVTVWDEPGDDYSQHSWVTRMALVAAHDLGADWIINGDADEFWMHPFDDLPSAFAGASAHVRVCERRNMVCPLGANERVPWWERLVYRAQAPAPPLRLDSPLTDPMPAPMLLLGLSRKVVLRGRGLVRVHQGNHSAEHVVPTEEDVAPIAVYHYPIRTAEQFEQKIRQGGAAYERNTSLPPEVGWHWRRWYRLIGEAGIEAALAEALPTAEAVANGQRDGTVILDEAMVAPLRELHANPASLLSSPLG